MFKNKLSEAQKEKIKKSNMRFRKMFKYSTSFVIAGIFIFLALVLSFANGFGLSIGNIGILVIAFCMGGILGSNIKDNIRDFENDLDQDIKEPQSDLLSLYLKNSVHTKFFKPEIYEKLTVLKLTKDEGIKNNLFQEILSSIDTSISIIEKHNVIPLDKPVSETERGTFLIILLALGKAAKLEFSTHSKTAGIISRLTQELGVPLSPNTISDKLKQAIDVLKSSNK